MAAVVVAALVEQAAHLGKVVAEFVGLYLGQSQLFDAGGIDDIGLLPELVALGEGGGVGALVGEGADLADADVQPGYEGVNEAALPYPAVAGYEGGLAVQDFVEMLDVLPCGGGAE